MSDQYSAKRIDVHHHFVPHAYVAELGERVPDPMRNWTVAKSLEDMERGGVGTAILSVTVPGFWFGDTTQARRLARACNEYGAQLGVEHPGRFGLFAALPFPDIEGSLAEISYAFDVLNADGIGLYTSYGKHYLGSPIFTPIYEELHRRKATVFVHPTNNECCPNPLEDVPSAIIEYGTDTTRTIYDLVFRGTASHFSDIRFIFSHGGGTMPFLIDRFVLRSKEPHLAARLPNGLLHELRKFFYDTAQAATPGAMTSLRTLVPASQVVFGTDFPYRSASEHVAGLSGCSFDSAELAMIDHSNARSLLPLAARGAI